MILLDNFSLIKHSKNNELENKDALSLIENMDFNDFISEFLIKKIHFSIVIKNFEELEKIIKDKKPKNEFTNNLEIRENEIICDGEIEKFFVDFFDSLISFIKKVFDNLREFLNFCYIAKTKEVNKDLEYTLGNPEILEEKDYIHIINNYFIFIFEKINFYLIRIFNEEKNMIYFINKSNYIAFKFLKEFLEFEKYVKKQNCAKNYKLKYSVSDIFIFNEKCLSKLQELIIIQKNFTDNYFQTNISNTFLESFEKENSGNLFVENTLFEKLKIIIKDNFQFLNSLEKSSQIFSITYEENYKSFLKELLNFLKNIYNKQVSYFSSARKINKFNILYLIDFSIKFLCFKNKLLQKVKKINWQTENKNIFLDYSEPQKASNVSVTFANSLSLLNNKISKINDENYIEDKNTNNCLFYEGLQILNNFIVLLTKDFKEKSFSDLIDLFEYNRLLDLDEEIIDTTCHSCNEDLKNLVYYIDSSNINKEYEYIIYEIILSDILLHINNELEASLKKNPKNKFFCHLAERIKNIMNLLISKFNKKEELKKDQNLNKLIKKFNSYMNTLKLFSI